VMTGFTPEQIPVLSGLARGFGVFDHWFCEVPSQTFTNRSFWTAATASGFVVNEPVPNWLGQNTAETIFNRLEQRGKTWKVYVGEPDRFSATGLIHYPRLKDRFGTHFVPFARWPGAVTAQSSRRKPEAVAAGPVLVGCGREDISCPVRQLPVRDRVGLPGRESGPRTDPNWPGRTRRRPRRLAR
jgi:hypothetical protein